jgi:hypothetical protein
MRELVLGLTVDQNHAGPGSGQEWHFCLSESHRRASRVTALTNGQTASPTQPWEGETFKKKKFQSPVCNFAVGFCSATLLLSFVQSSAPPFLNSASLLLGVIVDPYVSELLLPRGNG